MSRKRLHNQIEKNSIPEEKLNLCINKEKTLTSPPTPKNSKFGFNIWNNEDGKVTPTTPMKIAGLKIGFR